MLPDRRDTAPQVHTPGELGPSARGPLAKATNLGRRQFVGMASAGILGVTFAGRTVSGLTHALAPQDPGDVAKQLIVRTADPMNAEPELADLVQSWITPTRHFYVRSHAPAPELSFDAFRLSVEGRVRMPRSFSMKELTERFESVSTIATLTCAGNRRNEHSAVREVSGVQWDAGPIGNAEWTGIRLSDLLKFVELGPGAKHVWFESVDRVKKGDEVIPFGGSIPIEQAMAEESGVPGAIVTFQMNGKPLARDHGFPVRLIVPGYIGARSVKWVGRILVSDRPSTNHYLATAYKLVQEGTDEEWKSQPPIYRYPINSAICIPGDDTPHKRGTVRVAGYALPPGLSDRTISRVELSADHGKTWHEAELGPDDRRFCWRLWQASLDVTPDTTHVIVRAADSKGTTQPESVPWNLKGYLFNAYHQVPIKVS